MTSQTLREARKYEDMVEKTIQKKERPNFHLCAREIGRASCRERV